MINIRVHDYYWQDDYNCSVTTLKILSELYDLELNCQVIDAANGLSAGRCASQCGLVQGALMFIGIWGRNNGAENEQIKDWCRQFTEVFQQQFGSLLCCELRPLGFGPDNPPHLCEGLTQRAVFFAVEFIVRVKR